MPGSTTLFELCTKKWAEGPGMLDHFDPDPNPSPSPNPNPTPNPNPYPNQACSTTLNTGSSLPSDAGSRRRP